MAWAGVAGLGQARHTGAQMSHQVLHGFVLFQRDAVGKGMQRRTGTKAANLERYSQARTPSLLPTQANHTVRGARKQPPPIGRYTCS